MPVVLAYRVLESELGSIQYLCPVAVLSTGKDPPVVVLGLDNKYPKPGYKDVIDLSGSLLQSKSDVVQEVIVRCRTWFLLRETASPRHDSVSRTVPRALCIGR
jgi:hypothetical protein